VAAEASIEGARAGRVWLTRFGRWGDRERECSSSPLPEVIIFFDCPFVPVDLRSWTGTQGENSREAVG
jgi:hypothetical protein